MADFDKISINRTYYDVKDTTARQQITDMQQQINDLRQGDKKYYIFQADSYGDEQGEWPYLLAQIMGLRPDQYTIIADGGDGFSTKGIANNLFWNTLQAQANKVPDKNAVTDIVVCGGRNDCYNDSHDSILNGMTTYNTIAKGLFPNASLHIGFIGWDLNTTELDDNKELWLANACVSYIDWCSKNGVHYLAGVEYVMHNSALYQDDGKHPNSLGSALIAGAICNALVHGAADVQYAWQGVECTPSGICTSLGGLTLGEKLDNGIVTFWPSQYKTIITTTPTSIVLDGDSQYEIGDCPVKYFNGAAYGLHAFPVTTIIQTSDSLYYVVPANLTVYRRKLYYKGVFVHNNAYLTANNVNAIQLFPAGPVSFDTMS